MPSCEPERSRWISTIEQHQPFDYYAHTYFVCSLHFEPSDLVIRGKGKYVVKGRMPSIFRNENVANNVQQEVELESVENDMENNNDGNYNSFDLETNNDPEPELDLSHEYPLESNSE